MVETTPPPQLLHDILQVHEGMRQLAQLFQQEPPQPRASAAATAAQLLATLECAAARCHSPKCARAGVTQHPPRAELVGEAVTAAMACAHGGTKESIALCAVISSRYLPWAVRQFGAQDSSVKVMQAVMQKVIPQAAANAAPPASAAPKAGK